MRTMLSVLAAVIGLALAACTSGRDYAGVDPGVLKMCTEEARSLKLAADRGDYRDLNVVPGQDNSAQRAMEDARRARELQKRGSEKDLGDWPLTVLIDQCLVENGQPITEAAAFELTRWTTGEALAE